jgi:hypothetical protein
MEYTAMNKNMHHRFVLLFSAFALASCATGSSYAPKPVPAGYLYEGGYINVRVPNSDGWHLVNYSPAGMEFARRGAEPGESFAAQVLMFPLQGTKNSDEFLSVIKKGFEKDTDLARFEVIESNFKYTDKRGYPCVVVSYVTKDKQAQTSPTRREVLTLQAKSLYCRHPVRQETGFSIIYSHRGKTEYSNLSAESNDFINSVQVPAH